MPVDAQRIRNNGWRQGSVFSVEDGRQVLQQPDSDARLILVSHDCDIVHGGDGEPHVEVCVARPIGRLDGNFARAKNPRVLHLEFELAGNIVPHCVLAGERRWIDRALLESTAPAADARLSDEECRVIVRWLARRYQRAALPDRFNERLIPARNAIREAMREAGRHLSSVMLALNTSEELPPGELYQVDLIGVYPVVVLHVPDGQDAVSRAIAEIAAAMSECHGIGDVEFSIASEDEVTLDDLHHYVEYSGDDLSLGDYDRDPRMPRG